MRTDKFVYNNNEILKADIEVAHFGAKTLKQARNCIYVKRRIWQSNMRKAHWQHKTSLSEI